MHHYRDEHLGYGVSNTFWDRVFGTLALSKDVNILKLGLRKNQMSEYISIKDLYFRPFINLLKKGGFYEKISFNNNIFRNRVTSK